ncbi:MAG: hypothetical protein HQM08_16500 [Candidatus Riflebacteria bacterium]|nr:hypothetical protein [Candidatus Riflebacteria bacterium]
MKMKKIGIVICFAFLFLAEGMLFSQNATFSVTTLEWLSGNWESNEKGIEITEHWMKPSGNSMLGMGRTVSKGKTLEYEFLRIVQNENGEIFYIAIPSGQKETSFKLKMASSSEVVFENPEHDFPQRIFYHLEGNGTLFARVETLDESKGIDFKMRRVKKD